MCYTVLIWRLVILTLANNISAHQFNWHKPVCCIPNDKINLYQATFAFAFEFDEFWKLKFAFDECEFWTASSHHYWHYIQRSDLLPHLLLGQSEKNDHKTRLPFDWRQANHKQELQTAFCSCNVDPMISICKVDLDIWQVHSHSKNELSRLRLSEIWPVIDKQLLSRLVMLVITWNWLVPVQRHNACVQQRETHPETCTTCLRTVGLPCAACTAGEAC